MSIEVGKKYQDRQVPDWTIEIVEKLEPLNRFTVRYKDGDTMDLSAGTIESLYKPFEEAPCVS